jgi:hypothetical protein
MARIYLHPAVSKDLLRFGATRPALARPRIYFPPLKPHNPLKGLVSDERIQGKPNFGDLSGATGPRQGRARGGFPNRRTPGTQGAIGAFPNPQIFALAARKPLKRLHRLLETAENGGKRRSAAGPNVPLAPRQRLPYKPPLRAAIRHPWRPWGARNQNKDISLWQRSSNSRP